jgi:serine phosphatase RsbU (regulator of sigma subunit)
MDADGQVFGGDRLLKALERARGEPLDRAVASLIEDLERWTGPAGLRDDVSLVAVEFCPLSVVRCPL